MTKLKSLAKCLQKFSVKFEIEVENFKKIVTQYAKPQHIDAFLETHIFASVSSMCQRLCSVVANINAALQLVFKLQG